LYWADFEKTAHEMVFAKYHVKITIFGLTYCFLGRNLAC